MSVQNLAVNSCASIARIFRANLPQAELVKSSSWVLLGCCHSNYTFELSCYVLLSLLCHSIIGGHYRDTLYLYYMGRLAVMFGGVTLFFKLYINK